MAQDRDPFQQARLPDLTDPDTWRPNLPDNAPDVPITIGAHQHEMCRCIAILLEADKIRSDDKLMTQIRAFLRQKRFEAEELLDKVN